MTGVQSFLGVIKDSLHKVYRRPRNIWFRIFNARGNLAPRRCACRESESFRRILHYKRLCWCNARDESILRGILIRSRRERERETERERINKKTGREREEVSRLQWNAKPEHLKCMGALERCSKIFTAGAQSCGRYSPIDEYFPMGNS